MHIECLVEESSARAALENLLPKMLPSDVTFQIHHFNGKPELLRELPKRLKGYRKWLPEDYRIVVLLDEDRSDCRQLKQQLEEAALSAGFTTKSLAKNGRFTVLNRIVVEELEAWFFGDMEAVAKAFPRVAPKIGSKKKYRYPDAITGGTWEALERVLQRAGYFPAGIAKIITAREISRWMEPERNTSQSFQAFKNGITAILTS
ncbi:MAG TPA: DUF4276 family protein [Candidatus Ozemobacteraceae bacterium]|nr:DUF4276 family protein [Candidatus Ozemobacteraceae bacterium]